MINEDLSDSTSYRIITHLKIVDVNDIDPHEQYIEKLLTYIKKKIVNDNVFKDPIIADSNRGLVIDGTHRLMALRQLNYRYIPIIDFDYLEDDIRLGRWFRVLKNKHSDNVFNLIRKNLKLIDIDKTIDIWRYIDEYPLSIIYNNKFYVNEDMQWNEALSLVDTLIKNEDIEFIKDDEIDRFTSLERLIICYKKITRREILNIFEKGVKLSYKSTRHILPFRIMGINLPLKYLNDKREAENYLSRIKVTFLGRKVFYEDRVYEEDIYLAHPE